MYWYNNGSPPHFGNFTVDPTHLQSSRIMSKGFGACLKNLSLTIWRLTATILVVPHSYPPDVQFYIFIQQIYVLNILNMLHNPRFFLFKFPFIS